VKNPFEYYKNNFIFKSEPDLNDFVTYCIKRVEKYFCFLLNKGKIYFPFELSPLNAAVDVLSDTFRRKENQLYLYSNHFSSINNIINTNNDFIRYLDAYLFKIAKNNLYDIFSEIDPFTAKIIRNIKSEISKRNYHVTEMFDDKYIHKYIIDFNKQECAGFETLQNLIMNKHINLRFNGTKEFIDSVLNILSNQKEYAPAVSFSTLIYIYKLLNIHVFYKNNEVFDLEKNINYKLLFESVKYKYSRKLNLYMSSKKFSENDRNRMYNIIEDFLTNLLNGGIKKTPTELTRKFYSADKFGFFVNKVEYCLAILVNELAKEIRKV
jgi:hypothetical protein